MHSGDLSSELTATLADYVEAAAGVLRADLARGAEVPFELTAHRGRRGAQATLYCYEPLTDAFIVKRDRDLLLLPQHAAAVSALRDVHGLDRYLASRGAEGAEGIVARDMRMRASAGTRALAQARARAALRELLSDVFEGSSNFDPAPDRVRASIERLARAEIARASDALTIVATLHGVTISTPQIELAKGLTIAAPDAAADAPEAARVGDDDGAQHLLVLLELQLGEISSEDLPLGLGVHDDGAAVTGDDREASTIASGRDVLEDLLRALRLFGDGRVALGALAWVRAGGEDGRWRTIALGTGGHPHGMLVIAAEQEDELRAFCSLVSRRSPCANELAWALGRYELGCERESPYEGLSDHLLALRALLEPEGPSSGLLAGRIAALCATPEQRARLAARMTKALALERSVIAGRLKERTATLTLTRDVSDHLRALLRDMICGHLKLDLVGLADELLSAGDRADAGEGSDEQVLGDAGEPSEVVHVLV
ncbi:MAG TPA: hypothetical protein VEJ23_00785 [Solirubrobacteraceae bacterium]|nr:hypothetical protein [Solirubrobacteraceae bacterium]